MSNELEQVEIYEVVGERQRAVRCKMVFRLIGKVKAASVEFSGFTLNQFKMEATYLKGWGEARLVLDGGKPFKEKWRLHSKDLGEGRCMLEYVWVAHRKLLPEKDAGEIMHCNRIYFLLFSKCHLHLLMQSRFLCAVCVFHVNGT